MSKKLEISELNKIYDDGEAADRDIFAEMRSNVLLVAGEHYNKRALQQVFNKLRSSQQLTEYQKLRLTKNHTHKITRHYVANILSFAPGVTCAPKDESSLQNQKAAELNKAVWSDAKTRYRLGEEIRRYCRSFVDLGEVCVCVKYDPNGGEIIGYEPQTDQFGQPVVDPGTGQMAADESKPVFRGGFIFEEVFGFNLLRRAGGRTMRESTPWIIRKMVDVQTLKSRYQGDETRLKMIHESAREDFIVFDADRASYEKSKDQVCVREFYWPPGHADFPSGHWAITTKEGILEEGDLPGGIWPFAWAAFDEFPTTARGRSIIKVVRPYQAEINRASSTMALQQVTLGEDKVLYQAGTKLAPGALLPGVRGISFQGAPPQILAGRDGGQFLPYIQSQIEEMYSVAMMQEENEQVSEAQIDPYTMLFKSLKRQKRFAEYGEKFEQFLIDLCDTYLKLAKFYMSDDEVIVAVGRDEQVNIAEFKTTTPLSFSIVLEPRDETLETMFGRQMTFNHILQYVGNQLPPKDIGRLIRNMPFANATDTFEDFTLDWDNVRNDMLALERGVMPPMGRYEDHEYALQKLTSRTKKPDFEFLPDQVKMLYDQRIAMHEQVLAEQTAQKKALQSEFIPTDGAMIATDLYIPDPKDPSKAAKRARIPYGALDWLVNTLEAQGRSLSVLESQNEQTVADVARQLVGSGGQLPAGSQGGPSLNGGPTSPIGVSG